MEVVIELGREDKNINPFIEPLGEARRGKWRRSSVPAMNLADAELARLPDLPGYRVAVDVNAGTIRVFDPLQDDPRRPDIEKAVLKLLKRRLQIEPQQLTKEQPRATLYRWLMWMHRAVVAGHATGVGVEMPKETIDRVARERNADAKRAGLPPEVEA